MVNVDHGRPPAGGNYLSNERDGVKIDIHSKDLRITSVAVADYTKACGIADKATFVCWVLFIFRKRDIILSYTKNASERQPTSMV